MSQSISSILILIIEIITLVSILPFLYNASKSIANPTTENTQKVVQEGVQALVDITIPWWVSLLLIVGPIGVIIIILIAIFAPKLLVV